jgi:hypothetical protein
MHNTLFSIANMALTFREIVNVLNPSKSLIALAATKRIPYIRTTINKTNKLKEMIVVYSLKVLHTRAFLHYLQSLHDTFTLRPRFPA